ncbi:MAG: hypothetical protein IZT59_11405 [Verrucomicrobia bacterium]|nr:hypothetical protein [Verrucomicrobiota bacterium]|tara:strand:+ start:4422 stop:5210 length:789 start_codon:yes stop_codon:yes gene_type:complete
MIRFPGRLLLLSLSLCFPGCAPDFYQAENLSAKPFNQLDLAGNACGPAALLNSYRFGKPQWRKLSETPPGLSDRQRIRSIARGPAMRESSSLPGRARWSRNGINLSDLRDVANEIAQPHMLPAISEETLFLNAGESQGAFLLRVRSRLVRSLGTGFPPVLSIRRFVKRNGQWIAIQGHFVTITSVPGAIASSQTSFPVKYIDPWGGNFGEGIIQINGNSFMGNDPAKNPNLQAAFPRTVVGKRLVRRDEETVLAVSAVLGRF